MVGGKEREQTTKKNNNKQQRGQRVQTQIRERCLLKKIKAKKRVQPNVV